jgi:hypothetical protein
VYGLRVTGLPDCTLLSRVTGDSPELNISMATGRVGDRDQLFTDDLAEVALIDDGWVSVHRSGRAHFTIPSPISDDELLHPWLVPAAATFNGWQGRQVLHGGAVARQGHAIAVLGDKEDGKSTLLAWLDQESDLEILADDLVVIESGSVFSGPRCIDLRPGSAQVVGRADNGRLVRGDSRLRLSLGPCTEGNQLAAVVVLSWTNGASVEMERLSPADGLARLIPHGLKSGRNGSLLELLGLPIWSLGRPKTWAVMPEAAGHIESLLK